MIAWFEGFLGFLAINRGDTTYFALILVGIIQPKSAFRANKIILANIAGAEAARERRQSFTWEPHRGGGHFFDFDKALLAVIGGQSDDFDWLVAK